jgi:hypothetical protein
MTLTRHLVVGHLLAFGLLISSAPRGTAAEDPVKLSVVYIQVGYLEGDVFHPVEEGSGFLINSGGWVVTSQHVVKSTNMPAGKTPVIYGSVSSRTGQKYQLFEVPTPVVTADAVVLRFSPELPVKWSHLKILSNHRFNTTDKVTALGFPLEHDLEVRSGNVTNLLGQNGLVGVNPGLAPGMSGGPVTLGSSRCVVGIVAGGTGYPNFDYIVPIQLVRPLLDVPPAEFVTETTNDGSDAASNAGEIFDRSYHVDKTKDDHGLTTSSRHYAIPPFKAEPGAKVVSARLVEGSANNVGNKILRIAGDGSEAVFEFDLQSGPAYDQWRGWWDGQVVLTEQRQGSGQRTDSGGCGSP